MVFAMRRVCAVSLKGTFAIIYARPVSRTAPGSVHKSGALPLALESTKARSQAATFVSPPPRPWQHAARPGVFPEAPPHWSPFAEPSTAETGDIALKKTKTKQRL